MVSGAVRLIAGAACAMSVVFGSPVEVQAQNNQVATHVRACMKATRAPGSYAVNQAAAVPSVVVSNGGTERGARDVNDCLQDKYAVQFGAKSATGSSPASGENKSAAQCKTTRNQQKAAGGVLTAGTFVAAGAVPAAAIFWGGVAVGVTGNREYRDCLDRAGVKRQAQEVGTYGHFVCRNSSGGIYGGNSYC
ncbi:hypothetical protein [Shimia abyssi]|uniref:Uncharacterized protein n=1 Tax=Shimia abyssi TaxID=1662395 RepID=A0A2P8FEM8_9RHOB|nr:hypothetical protein [Shimia abyssi]PSL20173.1 hypothetical protein CLV88_104234 [Shimia abyssi]